MADNTSGNSEELKLRITPELDTAALKKVQDQLDDIKGTVQLGGKAGGKGAGASDEVKREVSALKELLRTQDLLVKQADVRLRKVRSNAEREIASIRERGAAEKLSLSEINNLISVQEGKIQRATQAAEEAYRDVGMELDRLKVRYEGINQAQTAIVNSQGKLFYANERLQSGFNSMSGSMQGIVSQTKNANLAFMNFGRIVQDAPFGLIGIANNIDPLIVSFQHLSQEIDINTGRVRGAMGAFKAMGAQLLGPAGLIFLLGSALPTALLFLQKYQQDSNKETDEAIDNTASYASKLFELKNKVDLASRGILDQEVVLKEFNDSLGKSLEIANDINHANEILVKRTPDYIKAMFLRQEAQQILNETAKEYVKVINAGDDAFLSFSEKLAFAGASDAAQEAKRLRAEKNRAKAQEDVNKKIDEANKLLGDSYKLVNETLIPQETKSKYFDKSIVDQTRLNILAEQEFSISNDQTRSWEERLVAAEKGVFYQRTSLDLQLKSLQDQRSQTKDKEEQLKLDSEILIKKNEIAKTDKIILDFQKQMSDARVDELISRAQMLQALEEEAAKYEEIAADEIDTGEKIYDARLKDAEEFFTSVSQLEIDKAAFTGNKLKALFLERKLYEANLTKYYMDLGYSREEAARMASNRAANEFALITAKTELEVQTEKFQAIGELATASIGLIFGENKNAQVAQVVIDTIMGIQKIWSQAGLNPVVGALGSAALAAKGLAAINKIKSTTTKSSSISAGSSGTTTREVMAEGIGPRSGQIINPYGTIMSASAQPSNNVMMADISIDARVDRRGLAIAVREGEQEIRTQQFSYT